MKLSSVRDIRGLTRPETLVLLAVATLLALLLFPTLASRKAKAERISCVGRLKNVGLSFRIWATDHTNRFPTQVLPRSNLAAYFRSLSNELSTPRILVCPADTRKPAANFVSLSNENLSYFLSLDADESKPQLLLAGDRNLLVNSIPVASGTILSVSTNTAIAWSGAMHRSVGNGVLGDGTVQQLTTARLRERISTASEGNRLLIP